MAVTVNIQDQCAAGHGKITITAGSVTKTVVFNKADVLGPLTDEEIQIGVLVLLRFLKVAAGVTGAGLSAWNQMKTKFNNRELSL